MKGIEVRLADICEVITKGTTPSNIGEEFTTDGVRYIRSEMINSSKNISEEGVLYISEETHDKLKRSQLKSGDILFSMAGVYLGKTAILRERDVPANTNQAVALIRVNPKKCNREYIYYFLNLPAIVKSVNSMTAQAAQPNINLRQIGNIPIVLPPQEVQDRVVAVISPYDELIENNQRQIKLLEEAARRVYKEWFVDLRFPGHENTKITDGVPKGWRKYKFSDTTSIMGGGTPKTDVKEFYNGNIPFYTPKDSDDSFFAFDTITHISQSGLDNCNSQLYPVNTIIITARGTVGKTTILAVPMAMNQSCYALKCDELNSPYYLFFSLKNEVAALKTMSNGGVFNTIIVKTFDSICLIAPTQDVLNMFEASVSPIMEQIKTKARQNIILTEARDRLLPKLMSGEIEL